MKYEVGQKVKVKLCIVDIDDGKSILVFENELLVIHEVHDPPLKEKWDLTVMRYGKPNELLYIESKDVVLSHHI